MEVSSRSDNSASGTFPYNSRSTESFSGIHVLSNRPVVGFLRLVIGPSFSVARLPSQCVVSPAQLLPPELGRHDFYQPCNRLSTLLLRPLFSPSLSVSCCVCALRHQVAKVSSFERSDVLLKFVSPLQW